MKKMVLSGTILVILAIASCVSNNKKEISDNDENIESEVVQEPITSVDPNFILRTNCYLCHNPNTDSHENILGPPLVASKFRYIKEYPERDAFVSGMKSFIMKPVKESALMKNPVQKFGVMPNTILTEEQVQAVVEYIFDNQVDEPAWFADHYQEEHKEPWLGQGAFDKMTLKLNE